MKKTILGALMVLVVACASKDQNSRKISSVERDLNGTYLGVADYGAKRVGGPNRAAVRVYFQEIEGEKNKYHVVLLEYVNLLKMAPSYITSNKIPKIANKTGYLKNITSNISAYEAVQGKKENTYELWPLTVVEDKIEVNRSTLPRILTLSSESNLKSPLEGATISSTKNGEPAKLYFPSDDHVSHGIQYSTAKAAYAAAKLESTWRKNFLTGPYLSQYYKKDDVVLNLTKPATAEFVINEKMSKMSEQKRREMFTNQKSAFLKGEFSVTEPRNGMFLFHPVNADEKTKEIVKGKIGLFIDIFDATKSLNQDVVELALIDTENPEDFLMYYEHPENGEGN